MAKKKYPWLGRIYIDMFNIEVPLFSCLEKQHKGLRKYYQVPDPVRPGIPVHGAVFKDLDVRGVWIYSMLLTPESTPGTWAHEAVHLADYIMDSLELPMDVSNTEVRAYMVGHTIDQICQIIAEEADRVSSLMQTSTAMH